MKITLLSLILASTFSMLKAQTVSDWTYEQLEARIEAGKDTTYLINFWATWCRPCVAEIPFFEALAAENQGSKLKIILMSVDFPQEKESRLLPFLAKKQYKNEVGLWLELNENEWINRVDKDWSGALPGTWVCHAASGYRKFYEREFHSKEELKEVLLQPSPFKGKE